MSTARPFATLALALSAFLLAAHPASAQTKTYIAAGDSLAYGFMDFTSTPPGTSGFPGYVTPFAQALQQSNGGVAYNVFDLGIVGETTSSFLNQADTTALNANYTTPQTQASLLHSTILSETAAGHQVGAITIQVGANDILGLAASSAFQNAVATNDVAQEQSLLNGTLATMQANYTTLLSQTRQDAPDASIYLLGFYNPYAALPPTSPANIYLRQVSPVLDGALNTLLQQEAAAPQIDATYVDLATPFAGHENDYTLANQTINTAYGPLPNDHPTALGYSVIAQRLAAAGPSAAVPEPSDLALLGLGLSLAAVPILRARRRREAAK